jgi:hypothetical protein
VQAGGTEQNAGSEIGEDRRLPKELRADTQYPSGDNGERDVLD